MIKTALANAKAAPVWFSPGIYYSCGGSPGPSVLPRGGIMSGSGGWIGVGAPGSIEIRPWPWITSMIYCNNSSAVGPIIQAHDGTTIAGVGIQGNKGIGGVMTCVDAINTVAHVEHDVQYIGCGGTFPSTKAAVDLSSSSTPRDQGTITQGTSFTHVACFYCGHLAYGTNANGGASVADLKFFDMECEGCSDEGIRFGSIGESQIDHYRCEDNVTCMQIDNPVRLQITNTYCHSIGGGNCIGIGSSTSTSAVIIDNMIDESVNGSPNLVVFEGVNQPLMQVRLTNYYGNSGFQYVTASGASHSLRTDVTVNAFDNPTIVQMLGGSPLDPAELWRFQGYAYTLGAGTFLIPSCNSGLNGHHFMVSDALAVPAYNTAPSSGGTKALLLHCDGVSAWVYP
jgi:hypothetical protein